MTRALAVASACTLCLVGAAAAATRLRTPTLAEAHAATVAVLRADLLSYHWVACITTDHHLGGATVVRCNVDFGDPHIVAYCTVVRGGRVLNQFADPAIPCGADLSGPQFTIVASR